MELRGSLGVMKNIKYLIIALLVLSLTSCADSVSFQNAASTTPVGFLHGLWHGTIAPVAWIVSLFSDTTAVYAIYNSGGWYDFGFLLGIGALSGTASRS